MKKDTSELIKIEDMSETKELKNIIILISEDSHRSLMCDDWVMDAEDAIVCFKRDNKTTAMVNMNKIIMFYEMLN